LIRAFLAGLALVSGTVHAVDSCIPAPGELLGYEPAPIEAGRRILHVGPGEKLATPAAAARAARDGDVVLVEAAEYPGSRSVWPQSRLLIRGVNGRPHLIAGDQLAQGKAIWVFNGDDVVVENIEFSEARIPGHNGAGIRAQGRRLTVRAGYFHDSDMGILSDNDPEQEITVEYSEFARNGHDNGKAHNLYIGSIKRFELRFSSSHGARTGHLVKSRARQNVIAYNRLADVPAGPSSYELDFPRSTHAIVIGNLILQSEASPNGAMLSYGAEDKARPPTGRLTIAFNTFVSLRSQPVFIFNHSTERALVIDNLFAGAAGQDVRGPAEAAGNLTVPMSLFADPSTMDFALRGAGLPTRSDPSGAVSRSADLLPEFEYVHPGAGRRRPTASRSLPGAFGTCSGSGS
jgi:hypothetical protein